MLQQLCCLSVRRSQVLSGLVLGFASTAAASGVPWRLLVIAPRRLRPWLSARLFSDVEVAVHDDREDRSGGDRRRERLRWRSCIVSASESSDSKLRRYLGVGGLHRLGLGDVSLSTSFAGRRGIGLAGLPRRSSSRKRRGGVSGLSLGPRGVNWTCSLNPRLRCS